MKTFEKLDAEELTDIELENESGVFRMKEDEEGNLVVELENKEGKKVILNDLLPEGWKMIDQRAQTEAFFDTKEIFLSGLEPKYWGWEYLLDILHEIGHAVIAESDKKQREIYERYHELKEPYKESKEEMDTEVMDEFNKLHSKIERDAWAYAIKKLRNVLEELDIDTGEVFETREDLKEHVHDALLSFKGIGTTEVENMDIPEEEREKLLEDISKLYTYKDVKKER